MSDGKLIVFDFDGTLVDSKPCFAEGLREFSEKRGLPHDIEKMTIGYVDPLTHDLGWQIPYEQQPELLRIFQNYMDDEMYAHGRFVPQPFSGVAETLLSLSAVYDLAIVTVRDRKSTLITLETHGMKDYFPVYRSHCCARERNYRIKPYPDALECLLRETGHRPENTVMIGDTNSDLDMAHGAGVTALAALWGLYPIERLEKSKPHRMLNSINEMPQILNEIFSR